MFSLFSREKGSDGYGGHGGRTCGEGQRKHCRGIRPFQKAESEAGETGDSGRWGGVVVVAVVVAGAR